MQGVKLQPVETSDIQSGSPAQYSLPWRVYIVAGCAALNSVNLGFAVGINAAVGPELEVDLELDHAHLEIFIASQAGFSILGALAASPISDRLGRRRAFAVAAITFEAGIFSMVSSSNFTMLLFGSLLLGLGIGFGLAADPIYISEIAPARCRGRLVTWSETGINVGIVTGFAAGYLFSRFPPAVAWRGMFLSGSVMPLMMLVLVKWVMLESPRWLIMKDRLKEAEGILQILSPADVDPSSTLAEIQGDIQQTLEESGRFRWRDLICCPSKGVRAIMLAGVGTACCQQLCGIDAIQFFMLFLMREAGIKTKSAQFQFMVALGFAKLIIIPAAGKILDNVGRRKTILVSVAGMMMACLGLSLYFVLGNKGLPEVALAMLLLYVCSFSVGVGPGAWLVASEIFPTLMRSKAMSLATMSNRAMSAFMASMVLSLATKLTWSGYFFVLALVNLAIFAFEHRYLPETKGKTLEELASHFARISGELDPFMLKGFAAQGQQPQEQRLQEQQQPQALKELPNKIGRSLGTDADACGTMHAPR